MTFGPDAWEWLARSIGARPDGLEVSRMRGSTSSSVFLVRARGDLGPRFVLRLIDNAQWRTDEPDLADHEAAALQEAERAGLRAPRLAAHSTVDVGFGAPVVLMTFVEGDIVLRPRDSDRWLDDLAGELASIHRHRADDFAWAFESWVEPETLAPPLGTSVPRAWERAIEVVLGASPDSRPVFMHRDYHPTNVLWQRGAVNGVIDWINACRGPAGADVAHCRTNLAVMYGPEAADRFLANYSARADGFEYNPYWDLDSLLDSSLPEPTYYPPWRDFGLEDVAPHLMMTRLDAYIQSLL